MFEVGMDVVCIDDHIEEGEPPPHVHKGQIYRIRAIVDADGQHISKGITLWFEEIPGEVGGYVVVNEGPYRYYSTGFIGECFRPVKKTDISVFEQLAKELETT